MGLVVFVAGQFVDDAVVGSLHCVQIDQASTDALEVDATEQEHDVILLRNQVRDAGGEHRMINHHLVALLVEQRRQPANRHGMLGLSDDLEDVVLMTKEATELGLHDTFLHCS